MSATGPAALKALGLALVVGVIAAFAAALYSGAFEEAQKFLYKDLPAHFGWSAIPSWWAGAVLFLGATVVALARRLPGATGDGPLTGFHFTSPARLAPSVLIAAFATLACGFALGPEAPLIVLGSAVGAVLLRKQEPDAVKLAMFLGGIAAIGSIFGNPLISGFMVLEFIAMGMAPAVLIVPTFVALASGYLVQVGVLGWPGLGVHNLQVPGIAPYPQILPKDLAFGLLVAVLAGGIGVLARRIGLRVDVQAQRRPLVMLYVVAAITLGALVIANAGFGLPVDQVLFNGSSGMPYLLAQTSVVAVLVTIGCKLVAYSVALGGGYRGGAIFPATFLGVALGVLASLTLDVSVTAMAAAGIAGTAASMMKLPATSALLATLLLMSSIQTVAPFAIYGAVIGFLIRVAIDMRFPEAIHGHQPLMDEPAALPA
jgi:H+/Cl- antiporter ClcA